MLLSTNIHELICSVSATRRSEGVARARLPAGCSDGGGRVTAGARRRATRACVRWCGCGCPCVCLHARDREDPSAGWCVRVCRGALLARVRVCAFACACAHAHVHARLRACLCTAVLALTHPAGGEDTAALSFSKRGGGGGDARLPAAGTSCWDEDGGRLAGSGSGAVAIMDTHPGRFLSRDARGRGFGAPLVCLCVHDPRIIIIISYMMMTTLFLVHHKSKDDRDTQTKLVLSN